MVAEGVHAPDERLRITLIFTVTGFHGGPRGGRSVDEPRRPVLGVRGFFSARRHELVSNAALISGTSWTPW